VKIDRICIVATGRNGDLLGLLPYFKWLSDHDKRPVIITSRQYGDILKHASYVDYEMLDIPFEACGKAFAHAKQKYAQPIDASVYGWELSYQRKCAHFGLEAWRRAGGRQAVDLFKISNGGNIELDGFNAAYHQAVVAEHIGNSPLPVVLLAFGANSSPLPDSAEWIRLLTHRLDGLAKVVDISDLRLRNVADLVALYRKAALLITVDSASLHLAGAVPDLPYLAFQNDGFGTAGWHAGHCRGNVIKKVNYSTALQERGDVISFARTFIKRLHVPLADGNVTTKALQP
jgi:hypothetical protein